MMLKVYRQRLATGSSNTTVKIAESPWLGQTGCLGPPKVCLDSCFVFPRGQGGNLEGVQSE